MNDLINRTIDFLERQHKAKLEHHPLSPEEIERTGDSVFIGSTFFVEKFTHILEQTIIDSDFGDGEMFVMVGGFKEMAKRNVRYHKILELNNQVTAYGADEEVDVVKGVQTVRVDPADNISRTWFTVYRNSAHSFSLMATRTSQGTKDHPAGPSFRGFWAIRPSITSYLCDYLSRVVNPQYLGGDT